MSAIRIAEDHFTGIRKHLFSSPGEHFAFLLAKWTYSRGEPVFMVRDCLNVPDDLVRISRDGWELTTDGIVMAINAAVTAGCSLIEAHNHGGSMPRFSPLDRMGLREFPPYVLDSLPGRPYAATVWGDGTIYGEFFLPSGATGPINSITVTGSQLKQLVSRDDDCWNIERTFDRQLPWFTEAGQRMLGRIRVAQVGTGGTGSLLLQNLVYLGVRDFAFVDDDDADQTSMNRLATATAADEETPKVILARRLVKSVAPTAKVVSIPEKVQTPSAIDALKGADVIFGCVDNDGARLVLNELALAYGIPYFDLSAGIQVNDGAVSVAGGRVAVVLPGGPCLNCFGEIDPDEARFFLSSRESQRRDVALGYAHGAEVRSPAVISLNAAVAAAASTEFCMLVSGVRPVNTFTELDLLGTARNLKSQWLTPVRVHKNVNCVQCLEAGKGDDVDIERYFRAQALPGTH